MVKTCGILIEFWGILFFRPILGGFVRKSDNPTCGYVLIFSDGENDVLNHGKLGYLIFLENQNGTRAIHINHFPDCYSFIIASIHQRMGLREKITSKTMVFAGFPMNFHGISSGCSLILPGTRGKTAGRRGCADGARLCRPPASSTACASGQMLRVVVTPMENKTIWKWSLWFRFSVNKS
jgi:hypothetical protein